MPMSSSKKTELALEVPITFDPSSITDMIGPAHSTYWSLQPFIAEVYGKTLGGAVLHREH